MKLIDLVESLDSAVAYKVTRESDKLFRAEAKIGDRKIIFMADKRFGDSEDWELAFAEEYKPGKSPTGLPHTFKKTGSGNSQQVYATLVKFMKEFMERYQPEVMYFSTHKEEPRRGDLMKRIVAKHFPDLELKPVGGHRYDEFEIRMKK